MKKRCISIFVTVLIVLSLFQINSYAEDSIPYVTLNILDSYKNIDPGENVTIRYDLHNFRGRIKTKLIATKKYTDATYFWTFDEDDFGEDYTGTYKLTISTINYPSGYYYIKPVFYYYNTEFQDWVESAITCDREFELYIRGEDPHQKEYYAPLYIDSYHGEDYSNSVKDVYCTKYSEEWVAGKWFYSTGKLNKKSSMTWHCDSTGWWVTKQNNKYFADTWGKIDGYWYYFKPDGYMAQNEWFGGYWFGSSGAWTYTATMDWHRDSHGWWIQDTNGWYPTSQWQKIDGVWRYFNSSGYMVTNQYVDGYWLGYDGRYY